MRAAAAALALLLLAAITGLSFSGRADAAEPRLFFCYVSNPPSSTIYVSDVHPVGPVAERAAYGAEFARYLERRGRVEAGVTGRCVMRATNHEIDDSRTNLSRMEGACMGCAGLTQTEDVLWPRSTKSIASVLAGTQVKTKPDPKDAKAAGKGQVPPGEGAWLMARKDDTDVVYIANQPNGGTLVRVKADLRPGTWAYLLQNNRCPGWIGIAFATDGKERSYFTATGREDAAQAKLAALSGAEQLAATKQGPDWRTGILDAFENRFEKEPVTLAGAIEEGPIGAAKGVIRSRFVSGCETIKIDRYATFGDRG
ncbi:MAG: hypothetical protein ABIN72_00180 [Sphingomicrobium sp.]